MTPAENNDYIFEDLEPENTVPAEEQTVADPEVTDVPAEPPVGEPATEEPEAERPGPKVSVKRIFTLILVAILLLIPTYIAIANYVIEKSDPLKGVTALTLTDPSGNAYQFDLNGSAQEIDGNTALYFMSLKQRASEESELPAPLVGTDHYTVVYSTRDGDVTEQYYFSKDPAECYFVDSEQQAYRLHKEDATKFVLSAYAKDLYKAAAAPILTMATGETLLPESMTWSYLSYNNEYITEPQTTSAEINTFLIVGGLNMTFSVDPDYLSLSITDKNDTLIWTGNYNAIATADLKEGQTYHIAAHAKWHENIVREAHGEASYQFKVKIKAAPSFYLEANDLEPGEMTVISGKNVDNVADITFTSVPSIDYTPVFYQDGDYVRALIPISIFIEEPADSYEFTVSCGTTTEKFTLNMVAKKFSSYDLPVSAELVRERRNTETLKAFADTVNPYLTAKSDTKYFGTEKILEAAAGRDVKSGFGRYHNLKTGTSYRHEGVDYVVYKGDYAQAITAGKVIFVGETTLSGKTVIVDHGMGLKSLYAHLSAPSVSVGDVLKQGDPIGVVGDTGFTSGISLHAGLYVNGVPICPYDLWDYGIPMTEQ